MRALVLFLAACWSGTPMPASRPHVHHHYIMRPCLNVWDQVPAMMHTSCDGLSEDECTTVSNSDISFHRARLIVWADETFARCRGLEE